MGRDDDDDDKMCNCDAREKFRQQKTLKNCLTFLEVLDFNQFYWVTIIGFETNKKIVIFIGDNQQECL